MTDLGPAMAAATAAITGKGTPEAVQAIVTDDWKIVWVRALSGPALCAMVAGCIAVLAFGPTVGIWTTLTESMRAQYVGVMGIILTGLLGLVFWTIMPGRPNKIEIKAGPASITVDGGPK